MDNYRKKIDEIKAPESLIAVTLNRIHQEQAQPAPAPEEKPVTKVTPLRKSHIWVSVAAAAAAVAVVLTLGIPKRPTSDMNIVYNTVPDSIIRTMPDDEHCTALSPAQYSDYLGLDITRITPTATLSKSTISVRYKDDTIIYDECLAYYTADGEPMMIRFSKTMSMVPSNLVDGQTSQVEDVTILAAVGENGCSRTAAFDWNGISICLYSSRMDQQTFEQFLLDFLNTLKK